MAQGHHVPAPVAKTRTAREARNMSNQDEKKAMRTSTPLLQLHSLKIFNNFHVWMQKGQNKRGDLNLD